VWWTLLKTWLSKGKIMATRNYKAEYNNYHAQPEQVKNRAERVKARRMMEKTGAVTKGDGKDVDHKKPLRSGGTTTKSNLRVRSKSANRSNNK
jgi:hypothetical protein